jgi:hypothetical protein
MKKLIILLALLAGAACFAQETKGPREETKLLVYYFHVTNRCNTCLGIEAAVKKTLEQNYKAELDQDVIVFRTFNVELPENKAISEKYDAYGATLALTRLSEGREKIVDMTDFAFEKIHNEDAFIKGLGDKIKELLK